MPTKDSKSGFDRGRYMGLAKQALENAEHKDALDYYDKILHHDSSDQEAWMLKGGVYLTTGQYESARNCFDQVLNLDPEHFEAVLEKGRALEGMAQLDDALQQYARAIRLRGTSSEAYLLHGRLLARMGRDREAVEYLDQCIGYDKNEDGAWLVKARCHRNLGEFREALKAFDSTVKLKPREHDAVLERGMLRARVSRHEEAVEDFNTVISIWEHDPEPYYHKALSLDLLGRVHDCREVLEAGLVMADRHGASSELKARMHFLLALTNETGGQSMQAFKHADTAMGLYPDEGSFQEYRQLLYYEYICDPKQAFLISLLDELMDDRPLRVHAALNALVEKGDRRTLEPVIATLYDPRVIVSVLLEAMPDNVPEELVGEVKRTAGKLDHRNVAPDSLPELTVKELGRLKKRYASQKNPTDVQKRTKELLGTLEEGLSESRESLMEDLEEFLQILQVNPDPELLVISLYFMLLGGLNYALLLGMDEAPHLLDLAGNTDHVRRNVFKRFSMNTSDLKKAAEAAFSKPRKDLVKEAKAVLAKDMVEPISRDKAGRTWLNVTGGGE